MLLMLDDGSRTTLKMYLTLIVGDDSIKRDISLGSMKINVIVDPESKDLPVLIDMDGNEYRGNELKRKILQGLSDEILERVYMANK